MAQQKVVTASDGVLGETVGKSINAKPFQNNYVM